MGCIYNLKQDFRRVFFLISLAVITVTACKKKTSLTNKTSTDENPVLRLVSPEKSGVYFTNSVEERHDNLFESFQYVYNGSGVALGDVNNDGLLDIYFGANENNNKLFLNTGNLQFKDITESARVAGDDQWTNGVVMVDINADGFMDIYVSKGGWNDRPEDRKNELFINNGDNTFKEMAGAYGIADTGYSMQSVFLDIDNDNDLDMYLINRPASFGLSIKDYTAGDAFFSSDARDKLYINNGAGKFIEEGESRGIKRNHFGHSLGVVGSDVNNDGFIDILITNDFEAKDLLYLNQGNGTFKESIRQSTNHISYSSMGVDIADLNNDGYEDIVTMEMQSEDYVRSKVSMPPMDIPRFKSMVAADMHKQFMHNMLLINHGNGFFSDVSQFSGMEKTDWSWAVLASDLDNDGLKDLMITNGLRRDITDRDGDQRVMDHVPSMKKRYRSPQEAMTKGIHEIIELFPPVKLSNYIFKNKGEFIYENTSKKWGFAKESFSNGAAVGDLDNDGDLDIVVNNLEENAFLYENTSMGKNDDANTFIKVKLKGPNGNLHGIGAKIWVYYDGRSQFFQNKTVRGYLSSSEPKVHFGLGKTAVLDSIRVVWPDGKLSFQEQVKVNQEYTMAYGDAVLKQTIPDTHVPIFHEVTEKLMNTPYRHIENDYDEYKEQILLPHEFAKNGPFVAVADVDGNGTDDFYVGGASGQGGQLYLQKNGVFEHQNVPLFQKDNGFEDMDAEFIDIDADGDQDLVVSSGGSEYVEGSPWYRARIYYNSGNGEFLKRSFLPTLSSSSSIAINDMDADGDLDIFIGGQVIANKYALEPTSHLFINDKNTFKDVTELMAPSLSRVGMVNAAIWVDVTRDRTKELVMVGEWMPLKIFQMQEGVLVDIGDSLGLEKTNGWWNEIKATDLDNDGDQDLVVGNLGENYKFKASIDKPFEVYVGDFDSNGTHDIFLAKAYKKRHVPIRGRECSSQQMPIIAKKFPSFKSFALADIEEIIGEDINNAVQKKSYMFSTMIFENDVAGFKEVKLPSQAQISSVQAIEILDFDNDGISDILIGGNKFNVEIETTPADASVGCLLKGNGNLEFTSIPLDESGFFIPYNVKDIKKIKVGGTDCILVTSNDDYLRAFEKTSRVVD